MDYTIMHGAGNGFVLLDNSTHQLDACDFSELAVRLCRRENMDGLIRIEQACDADVAMVFYNRDGSEGEMCGNGARCLARYAAEHGLARDPARMLLRTAAGIVPARRVTRELYEIRLNDPSVLDLHRAVHAGSRLYDCFYTELGRPGIPHAVLFMDDSIPMDKACLRDTGSSLRHAPEFPKGANVSFVWQMGPDEVRAFTFERGVEDFTLACGTGCGAIAAAMALLGKASADTVLVHMPGGDLTVRFARDGSTVRDLTLTGPTAVIGQGTI